MSHPHKIIAIKIPNDLLAHLDNAVTKEDSDRSKFIRNAVRERIRRVAGPDLPPSKAAN